MRILIYGLNFAPEVTGVGRYTSEMVAYLISQGHQVKVVTSYPYYPQWRIASDHNAWTYKRDNYLEARVLRCPIWVPSNPTLVRRLLHLLSFAVTTFIPLHLIAFSFRPKVIWTVEPTSMGLPAALTAARLVGANSWLHIQDIEASAVASLTKSFGKYGQRIIKHVYTWLLRRFSRVSTISETMRQELVYRYGLTNQTVLLLRNWVDTQKIHPLSSNSRLKNDLGLNSECLICLYSGNIGEKQGVESLVEAAEKLKNRNDIRFVLCGDGAARERIVAKTASLTNVSVFPLQPEERLNELMNMADIHLLPQRIGTNDYSMPSKLAGMLASGRPIIAQAPTDSELAGIVRGCGLIVPPNDGRATANAIMQLLANSSMKHAYGNSAREKAVTMFSTASILDQINSHLQEIEPSRTSICHSSTGK